MRPGLKRILLVIHTFTRPAIRRDKIKRERETPTVSQTDRQTGRHTDRQRERQTDRQTGRQTDIQTDR